MSFSSGVYSLPGPALNTGDTVSATENNTFRNDVATAFNLTMLRNGTSTATANLPMGGYKLTGLGNGTASGDSLAYGQTADAVIYGITLGRGSGAVSTNTAVGASALSGSNTGAANTALGASALAANTLGANSTAVGNQAGLSNTTGEITAIGEEALKANTTGAYNTAVGVVALLGNTTGSSNTAVGRDSLRNNTTASNNTAVGYQAGYSNSTGASGVFIGQQAGYSNSTGAGNTYIGQQAGYSGTDRYNTLIGSAAGYNSTGNSNTFVGAINGSGYGCGQLMTTGSKNTILGGFNGNQGGLDIRTANNYIVLSDGDGNPAMYWTGSQLWKINSASGLRYCELDLAIGGVSKSAIYWDNTNTNLYVVNASGGVYLTNTGTSWTSNSDERLKENLTPIENGLSKVCSLRSVIGNFIADETKKPTPFLIAQDVQAVLPEAVTTSTLKDDDTNTEYLGVAYTEVIPLLVAAIKELKADLDATKAELAILKGQA